MTLLTEIYDRLKRVSDLTIFGTAVRGGIETDLQGTIEMIVSQAKDNRTIVSGIVGEGTLMLIETYAYETNTTNNHS